MVSEFGVRRSTVSFKIAVAKLIDAKIELISQNETHIVPSSFSE